MDVNLTRRQMLGVTLVALVALIVLCRCDTSSTPDTMTPTPEKQRAHPLDKLVSGIGGLPEVRWIERDDNSIYVGFAKLPDDVRPLIRAWAMQGNAMLDFGVHVWAVEGVGRGWRPGEPGRFVTTTARGGTIRE